MGAQQSKNLFVSSPHENRNRTHFCRTHWLSGNALHVFRTYSVETLALLTEVSRVFTEFLQSDARIVTRLGNDRFLQVARGSVVG